MQLWILWWNLISSLRPAFSRSVTFFWFVLVIAAFSVRQELLGVTSFIRALCLRGTCYDPLLHFFHSSAVKVDLLAQLWFRLVLNHFPILRIDGQPVLILDGFKKSKEGKKMPGVKFLHQQSESNSKPRFIMGHSFQAFGVLCSVCGYEFCVPICARIHEGIVRSNRDKKTLIDKAMRMLEDVCGERLFGLVADAYYANGKSARFLNSRSSRLVTRVRGNAVGYRLAPALEKPGRGRPRKYGARVRLRDEFNSKGFATMDSPVYGEKHLRIQYKVLDLLWKPVGGLVRFVLVDHPRRGKIILMCTDQLMNADTIIQLYGLRFKIEVAFKQAVHTLGTYGYHFWMAAMKPLKRRNGNQYLHRTSAEYRRQVERKIHAYHVYVQCGTIAQGILQYLSMTCQDLIWKNFGTWIRTIRPDVLPSEMVVSEALKNTFSEFLLRGPVAANMRKFILSRIDLTRPASSRFIAW